MNLSQQTFDEFCGHITRNCEHCLKPELPNHLYVLSNNCPLTTSLAFQGFTFFIVKEVNSLIVILSFDH